MASPTGYAAKRPQTLGKRVATGTHQGAYSAATLYAAGDTVEHEGVIWRKTDAAVAGTEPTFASASWAPDSYKGSGTGKTLNPASVGGSDTRTTLGTNEGQPSSSQLADVADRTAAEA